MTKTLSSVSLIKRASLLNRVTYNLKLSFSYCLMFSKLDENLLYLCPPMKCETKFLLNSLKVEMVLRTILLNHTLANPLSVVGKTLHMILSRTPCSYIRVLMIPDGQIGHLAHHMLPPMASGTWLEGGRR